MILAACHNLAFCDQKWSQYAGTICFFEEFWYCLKNSHWLFQFVMIQNPDLKKFLTCQGNSANFALWPPIILLANCRCLVMPHSGSLCKISFATRFWALPVPIKVSWKNKKRKMKIKIKIATYLIDIFVICASYVGIRCHFFSFPPISSSVKWPRLWW